MALLEVFTVENPSNCPVEIHLIKIIHSYAAGTVCVGCQPAPSSAHEPDLVVPLLVQMCRLIADPPMRKLFFLAISKHVQ